ncbi:hypothetical protein OXPF_26820 [Oxobacter pfennigii]|uniref:Uncharacterized protein n=1 Tax=Oxobacter pfennigii TaxID=36849 RepID=A0A0P8YVT8_9CLOT|nr:hypothetical protein [Oxobacter pfennigii]KPU43822.1 hypothetical protein OXPF_26820 [Oxobacter pfennigii]
MAIKNLDTLREEIEDDKQCTCTYITEGCGNSFYEYLKDIKSDTDDSCDYCTAFMFA